MSISISDAYKLIENLDYDEGLKRKFAPGYSLIQVGRDGEIVSVRRFKELPTEADQIDSLRSCPDTIQINGSPGMYSSLEIFSERIHKSMRLFSKLKKPEELESSND